MADIRKLIPIRSMDTCKPCDGVRIGTISSIDKDGNVFVVFRGREEPVPARLTSSASERLRQGNSVGCEVLLYFENNNAELPIIVDTLHHPMDHISYPVTTILNTEEPQDVTEVGKRIMFEAEDEIVLKCGKASVTLTKAGKILLKGEYLLSHSSGKNRIKGASISIN
jgi:hypothetical protein